MLQQLVALHDPLLHLADVAPARPLAALPAAGSGKENVRWFAPAADHFKIPHGLWLREATAVAVDSADHVYVFSRGNMPVMVFSP